MLIEYKVRPVTRYVITRFEESDAGCSSEPKGEYSSHDAAYETAYALCKQDHEKSGLPVGDDRIRYPNRPSEGFKPDEAPPKPPAP